MKKEIDDTVSVIGKRSAALILGFASGVVVIGLGVYLVLASHDTSPLWPLIAFSGSALGFGVAESSAAKKLAS